MKSKRYSAFTLIEMLVVMIILTIIGSLSFATYQDMQTTIRLNEYSSVLEENMRRVQREAMLLKREQGEGWIYGLGIDFSNVQGNSKTGEGLGEYRVFKWCASEMDYGSPKTSSYVPGYNPDMQYGLGNGQLPTKLVTDYHICKGVEDRLQLSGYDIGIRPPRGTILLSKGTSSMGGPSMIAKLSIQFILFESVTGRAFFYGGDGHLIGYEDVLGVPVLVESGMPPFKMTIQPSGAVGRGKEIAVEMFSGKVTVGPIESTNEAPSLGETEINPEPPNKDDPVIQPVENPTI